MDGEYIGANYNIAKAKDFSRYLEQQTGIRFREKAKQFLPEFDESNKMLIVILDEEHLK